MQNNEVYTELSIQLARLEDKIDKLLDLEYRIKVLEAELDTRLKNKYYSHHSLKIGGPGIGAVDFLGNSILNSDIFTDLVEEDGYKVSTPIFKPGGGI